MAASAVPGIALCLASAYLLAVGFLKRWHSRHLISKVERATFRKSTTKGKLKTRVVDIQPGLAQLLDEYQPPKAGTLFPGMRGRSLTLTRFMADKIFKAASGRIGLEGVSTHSFRRTALTIMSSAGIPLRVIQEISGHNDLGTLQRYLEVSPEQKKSAMAVIGF